MFGGRFNKSNRIATMKIGVMLRTIDEKQGIGVYTINLMREMLAIDTVNDYLLMYRNPDFAGTFSDRPNVKEIVLPAKNKIIWDQFTVPRAAAREGVQLLFHTKFTVPFFSRIPSVMSAHGASWFVRPDIYPNKLDLAYIRTVMPFYCRKSSAIVANSDLTRNDYIRVLRVPPEKITTVRLGMNENFKVIDDQAHLDAMREKHSLPEKYIFSVIKYDPRKNFDNLIKGFRLLRKRMPVKLVVAGIGCEKYREEYNLAEDGIDKDITFLGWVEQDELPALYNMAACMLFPSVYEEFGIPTVEAMACGCPVVISSTGALPELAGDAGIIVDPFNPKSIADGLEKLMGSDENREKHAALCLERSKMFSWHRCAKETLAVLNGFASNED
jgi:glycosyltransferase involved in cell wall biosynthesis